MFFKQVSVRPSIHLAYARTFWTVTEPSLVENLQPKSSRSLAITGTGNGAKARSSSDNKCLEFTPLVQRTREEGTSWPASNASKREVWIADHRAVSAADCGNQRSSDATCAGQFANGTWLSVPGRALLALSYQIF